MPRIIRDAGEATAKWASLKAQKQFVPPYTIWGIADRNCRLIAALIFNDFADHNIEMSYVGKGGFSKGICRQIAKFCFIELDCERVTLRTKASNQKLIAALEWGGFVKEGTLRKWYGDENAVVLGMLKEECRFL